MDRGSEEGRTKEAMDTMEARAMHAFQSLELIERATMNGCSPRALQDIVGNLLVMLAWIEDGRTEGRSPTQAIDPRVRSLVVDCLARAGVPARAVPDSLHLIRDCFAEADISPGPPYAAGTGRSPAD
jgi:hypothetical protein